MPLPRTDTLSVHDLPVMCVIHEQGTPGELFDRLILCPFDGYIERMYVTAAGVIGVGAGNSYNLQWVIRDSQGASKHSLASIALPDAQSADTPVEVFDKNTSTTNGFSAGDTIEFSPVDDDNTSATTLITATVILKRV